MGALGRWGVPAGPAANDVQQGIDTVRSLLKIDPFRDCPHLTISPRCAHLIDELRQYRWDPGKLVKPQPLKRNDDAPDAARYMLHTVERGASDEAPGSADVRAGMSRRRSIQISDWRRKIRGLE